MHDRPDKTVLLAAVAKFFAKDVQPLLAEPSPGDKGMAFRALIAANLAQIVASEIATEEAHDAAQLARLQAIYSNFGCNPGPEPGPNPGQAPTGTRERQQAIRSLSQRLSEEIRTLRIDVSPGSAAFAHVEASLQERLQVVNPRFDLSYEESDR